MEIKSFKLRYTNCFLVRHAGGWLLVDTGYDWEWPAFARCLAESCLSPRDISHLLLTHAHDDHAGLLNRMVAENPGIAILASDRAVPLLAGGAHVYAASSGYVTRRMRFLAGLKAAFDKGWTHSFPPYGFRAADHPISGPTRLSALGVDCPVDGVILPTPGHTDDSISLLFDDGDCLCGDAAANFFRLAGTRKCVIYVRDIDEYYRSWDLLLASGAKRILPSHGPAFPAEALRRERGRHRRLFA